MNGILTAEARKLLATSSSRRLIAAGPLLAAGMSVLVLALGASGEGGFGVQGVVTEVRSDADLRDFATIAAVTTFLALALGVTEATSEFRYATIVRAMLARPRRWQTVVAKALVITMGGAVLTLTATLACLGVAAAWLAAHGQSVPMGGRSAALLIELAVTGGWTPRPARRSGSWFAARPPRWWSSWAGRSWRRASSPGCSSTPSPGCRSREPLRPCSAVPPSTCSPRWRVGSSSRLTPWP